MGAYMETTYIIYIIYIHPILLASVPRRHLAQEIPGVSPEALHGSSICCADAVICAVMAMKGCAVKQSSAAQDSDNMRHPVTTKP